MKKWFWMCATLMFVFVLAACGNEENQTPEVDGVEVESDVNDVETPVEDSGEDAGTAGDEAEKEQKAGNDATEVEVDLLNQEGQSVGTATLTQEENGVKVKVAAKNLPPGTHGFHFHETGVCKAPDFESAGGHFNPDDNSHGFEHEEGPHAGDLPNLAVEEDGTVVAEVVAEHVTLASGEPNSLLKEGGTALVIHAGADDGKTQPSGDSGDRLVCGVITQ